MVDEQTSIQAKSYNKLATTIRTMNLEMDLSKVFLLND